MEKGGGMPTVIGAEGCGEDGDGDGAVEEDEIGAGDGTADSSDARTQRIREPESPDMFGAKPYAFGIVMVAVGL